MDSTAGTGHAGLQDEGDSRGYATKGVGPDGFPTDVATPGTCPYDGCAIPPGPTRGKFDRRFGTKRCRSNWHTWRSNLAAKRIAEAAKLIEAELPFLRRG